MVYVRQDNERKDIIFIQCLLFIYRCSRKLSTDRKGIRQDLMNCIGNNNIGKN